jgi:hypothetical protein
MQTILQFDEGPFMRGKNCGIYVGDTKYISFITKSYAADLADTLSANYFTPRFWFIDNGNTAG